MSVLHAILLGMLQGLTEFIPVSSTAHLLIGQTLLRIPPGEAMFSFLVIVQWGTILSLLIFFWKDLGQILRATLLSLGPLLKQRGQELDSTARLGWYILLATFPALLAGYLLRKGGQQNVPS
ncbi:MAG: undecaprenyl-diphosphate phosphatase, partial [Candidatus Villigracilaceae bacterium]